MRSRPAPRARVFLARVLVGVTAAGAALAALFVTPARADLNIVYGMVEKDGTKSTETTARWSMDATRVAVVVDGEDAARLLYDADTKVLRMVTDSKKRYFDLDEPMLNEFAATMADMRLQMEQQLASLPEGQRARAREMMAKVMGGMAEEVAPPEYLRMSETKTISGFQSTRYDVVRGGVKVGETWASTDGQLQLTAEEMATFLAMQEHLARFLDTMLGFVKSMGANVSGAFRVDESVEGFPVKSVLLDGDTVTMETTLTKADREPIDAALFIVPKDYKKEEIKLPKM
jgi:hypothetical protein